MPPGLGGSLTDQDYAAILAYIMRENRARVEAPLVDDLDRLAGRFHPRQASCPRNSEAIVM